MATLSERSGNWNASGIIRRDFRHDKSDGYEDTPHKSKHGKKSKRHVGCPGNNDGPHVYVWTRETFWKPLWGWNNWFWYMSDYEFKTCAGCYKHKTLRRRKGVR